MEKIIELDKVKQNIKINKNIVLFLDKMIEPLKAAKKQPCLISPENIKILEENLKKVNEKAIKGVIEHDEFESFVNMIIDILDFAELDLKYYYVLFLYKLYNDYGINFFFATFKMYDEAIKVFLLNSKKENVNKLCRVIAFIYDEELARNFYDAFGTWEDIRNFLIKITNEMLKDENLSLNFVVKENIDYYRINEMTRYYDEDFNMGVISPKIIKDKMTSQLSFAINFYKNKYKQTNNETYLKKALELEDNLNTLVLKLYTLKKEDEIEVFDKIREIWTHWELTLIQKADMIFEFMDVKSNENIKTLN